MRKWEVARLVMLEEKGRDGAAAAASVLCFAACEGYDVMLMTAQRGGGVIKWIVNMRRQGEEVEKVRRLTYAHGWRCANKLVVEIAGLVGLPWGAWGSGRKLVKDLAR